jgi:hypothetical protein
MNPVEMDQSRAHSEFRRTLSVLNSLLGEGRITIDRETVALGSDPDASTGAASASPTLWLDVEQFHARLAASATHDHPADEICADCVPLLQEAAEMYQDDFVAGFNLPDSLGFEEWQLRGAGR